MNNFDPYHEWLGIPPDEQPPNHYRLLGIPVFEPSDKVISNAADRQMLFVRQFQKGEHLAESQKLLNEIAGAKVCLLNAAKKSAYDEMLRSESSLPDVPTEVSFDLFGASSAADFVPNQQFPDDEPVVFASQPKHAPSLRGPVSVRIIGHILAPIIGVSLGWLILHWMRGDRSEPAVASPSMQSSARTAETSVPSEEGAVVPQPNPFNLENDSATPAPAAQVTPAENSQKKPEPPAESPTEQLKAERNKALADGNITTALMATGKLADLEGRDSIRAKFDLLQVLETDEALPVHEIAEQMLYLLDEANEGKHEATQQIAVSALLNARQTNDSVLIRKATLSVLKTQSLTSDPEGE